MKVGIYKYTKHFYECPNCAAHAWYKEHRDDIEEPGTIKCPYCDYEFKIPRTEKSS